MVRRVVRSFITLVGAAGGFGLANFISRQEVMQRLIPEGTTYYAFIVVSTLLASLIAFIFAPSLMRAVVQAMEWTETSLQKMPTQDLLGGAVGLIIGLIIASLLGYSFSYIPVIGGYLAILVSLILGYLGMKLGMRRKDDLLSVRSFFPRFTTRDKEKVSRLEPRSQGKILDTSVIIDGRIADICRSGFLEGTLWIPSFVLEELRHIADSSDLLKRSRGRRGLDILNAMRKELDGMVQIYEGDFEDLTEVDSKLVRLAQTLGAQIVTNDYNLNKVAELQGIRVLNINELANAVKPIVLPGEEMNVQVIKDGKEAGQGIGYLDDGTMIVVDGGKKYIGQTIDVFVTSVFQTAAGRMIFAKPRMSVDKKLSSTTASSLNEVNVSG
ncbi:MAG: PIN/TRAM domain-containing protein [Firmicutes bacterium]|nr:PIN/TRAM domain-containing protein [Bacillota bacterium]